MSPQPIKVTFLLHPEDDERDSSDDSGLTSEAFDRLHETLATLGADDIQIERS